MSHSAKLNTVSQTAPLAGSLAIQQLIETYEEQVATTGSTPQLEMELERLYAQRQTSAVGAAKAAEAAASKVAKKAVHDGKELACRACNASFFLTENQSNFFRSLNLAEPKTCQECRAAKKAARFMLPCLECESEFEFTPADQAFFAKQGWGQPKRCVSCRAEKLKAQSLSCVECKKEFNFSVGTQKHFKAQGWRAPTRCHWCREAKKALKNVAPAAVVAEFREQMSALDKADDDAEALRIVEEAFAAGAPKPVEFGFALPEGAPPAIFSGAVATQ